MTRDEITALGIALIGFGFGFGAIRREAAAIDTEWRVLNGVRP